MTEENIKNEVLKKIETGQIYMKPKSFYYFKIILLILSAFFGLIISALLLSYIFYSIRIGGYLYLLGFGTRGVYEFIMVFPWLLLVLDVVILIFVDWLIKSFKFGYNSPVIYLFLGTFMLMTIFGSLINFTSFNRAMMYRAEVKKDLPVGGSYYGSIRRSKSSEGIFRGVIQSVGPDNSIVLMHSDFDGDNTYSPLMVFLPEALKGKLLLEIGDEVFIAGEISTTSQVKAYGISKIYDID
jgi:hypothetical protein